MRPSGASGWLCSAPAVFLARARWRSSRRLRRSSAWKTPSCGSRRSRRSDEPERHLGAGRQAVSGRRVRAIVRRLLQQFRRDRRTMALVFVVPIVILSLLGYLLRGGGSGPKVDLVNQDSGALCTAIAEQVASAPAITGSRTDLPTPPSALGHSAIAGSVVLPAGLSHVPAL